MTCKDDDHLASLLGFVSDHCVVMNLQVPREALEIAGMSINFRSGKFGYSICPIFSKGHAEIPVCVCVVAFFYCSCGCFLLVSKKYLFYCLSEMAGSSHRRSATPQY